MPLLDPVTPRPPASPRPCRLGTTVHSRPRTVAIAVHEHDCLNHAPSLPGATHNADIFLDIHLELAGRSFRAPFGLGRPMRRAHPCRSGAGRWRKRSRLGPMKQTVSVAQEGLGPGDSDDVALVALFAAIGSDDYSKITRMLDQTPGLAVRPLVVGATRQDPTTYFLASIHHHLYEGDTALHVAAAAYHRRVAEALVARDAAVSARNRRGAEPLHYAADGRPSADDWDPDAQGQLIAYLIDAGADPNSIDKSGVAPLHRAVRTRSCNAAKVLIDKGADPLRMNKSGSTPLHLAVQNTGKSSSGSDAAKREQQRIIVLLLEHGATPSDVDAKGKTVASAASSDWIRQLLDDY